MNIKYVILNSETHKYKDIYSDSELDSILNSEDHNGDLLIDLKSSKQYIIKQDPNFEFNVRIDKKMTGYTVDLSEEKKTKEKKI